MLPNEIAGEQAPGQEFKAYLLAERNEGEV